MMRQMMHSLWTLAAAAALSAGLASAAPPLPKVIASTPPADDAPILKPADALKTFEIPNDLEIGVALAEPEVRQPLFINWDERGRMWVVQYLQYPEPAGLKTVSRDEYWRAVYDRVPPPPPNHIRGLDKITIHEDTDGDGVFDAHKVFVEGLSIVTACERGRGGVWVLNPPYLLFYPDKDNDDVPDGDPEVHLQGFGIEDTHSVTNSLRWGPDGWLYAAQGSTVSAHVIRPGLDKTPVHSMGQAIWRYHPETRRYEIFAEGGGNAFSCEIDNAGQLFSGHNGGNARGFHYVQGGYYQKGFAKHGPLSNPFAFGYFSAMEHHDVPRFTHNFVIYEGGALPEAYRGRLFGVEPLQGRVVMSDVARHQSTFRTHDVGFPVTTSDRRFRPVEIKTGPDGAIYVADLYEPRIAHREHFLGHIDKDNGRIYRLQAKGAAPFRPVNLAALSDAELVEQLTHPNKWFRQTALRLLADRKPAGLIPSLKERLRAESGPIALQYLFALNACGGLDAAALETTLQHPDAGVREWSVRLACDANQAAPSVAGRLVQMAAHEPDVRVRSQLAASARRLPASDCLPIVAALAARDEDADEVHIPLLVWWAIESKAEQDRDAVLALFADPSFWDRPLVARHLLNRIMQRYAAAGSRADLASCAQLLQRSPHAEATAQLMRGFEAAFKGRSLTGLPDELVQSLAQAGGVSLTLAMRQGRRDAVDKALVLVADPKADPTQRLELLEVFGETNLPESVPVLLDLLRQTNDLNLQMAALTALQRYDEPRVGETVVGIYSRLTEDARSAAETLLLSRAGWTRQFLEAVDAGRIEGGSIPPDTVRKATIHRDERIAELLKKHWPDLRGASTAEMQAQIARLEKVLRSGEGDPYPGKELFAKTCAKCHILFGEGGRIGPDLTAYKRDDPLNLLINVVNPSAEIREGFESYLVLTQDGRAVTGFLADKDNRVVVIRGVDGQNIVLERENIDEMQAQRVSLMPEGLLRELDDTQIRDLFAYLRSSQPLNK